MNNLRALQRMSARAAPLLAARCPAFAVSESATALAARSFPLQTCIRTASVSALRQFSTDLPGSMHVHGRSPKDLQKWEEFKAGLSAKFVEDIMYRVSLFKKADTAKDGTLSLDELKALINELDPDMSTEKVEELMKNADVNGDGVLQIEEFKNLFK
eukprot:CAMPEP_0197847864 /NCGR_PEP_ID=MMETSP1438-20131217/7335_1 /TAXON_ID=1461541 /ORGANISM="Pterosperma sp., Strain CCMP1384" /LENGTH=156 /DNA_ID=CAMNT_0043459917 /DNA_START=80 /DNA_END=550 /DNA_ORIENTATION=+